MDLRNKSSSPLQLDLLVEGGVGFLGKQTISSWLFLPETSKIDTLLVCLAGGGFSKSYYHSVFQNHPNYSFAEYMCTQGFAVLALDNLGMGDSDKPANAEYVNKQTIAQFHHAALQAVLSRLKMGEWGEPATPSIIGIGHSMGAMILIEQQASCHSFDKIVVLGWSNIGLDFDISALESLAKSAPYLPTDRNQMRPVFHMENVPEDVITQDNAHASLTPSPLAVQALQPGIVRDQAARITVPVFLTYGERDISPDISREAAFYANSADVTLFTLEGSAHNHNFARTRINLWQNLEKWISQKT